jgi:hypothetical protein
MSKLDYTAGRPVISDLNSRQQELSEQIRVCKTREDWQQIRNAIAELKLVSSDLNQKISTLISIIETKQVYDLAEYPILSMRLIELVDEVATVAKDRLVNLSMEVHGKNSIEDKIDGGSGEW